jgi:hypothetical protein
LHLEERCVPASIVVNIASEDPNPGNGMMSLRDALAIANANNQPDTITFAPGITTVTTASGLEVTEPGQANATTIDGGGVVVIQEQVTANTGSVLSIGGNSLLHTAAFAQLDGLTLTGGEDGFQGGGGLYVDYYAHAMLDHVTVRGNVAARNNNGPVNGGGILNLGVTRMTDCTVLHNNAIGYGGGIYNAGQLVIENSTIADNSSGLRTIVDPFVGAGGGIYNSPPVGQNPGGMVAINCTITGNRSASDGGGIYAVGAAALTNVTITHNRANPDVSIDPGAGLVIKGPVTANNTIISGNWNSYNGAADDVVGTLSAGSSYNLIGGNAGVGRLADNGGPTLTCALLPGSPAAAAGSIALAVDENGNPLITDQRGSPRTTGGTLDIGAAEFQGLTPLNPDQLIVAGSGPGGPPRVNVYDAQGGLVHSFLAFNPAFRGGVRVANADVNGDGVADIVVAAGPRGGPQGKVLVGTKLGI